MTEYTVVVQEVMEYTVTVNAPSQQDAYDTAHEAIGYVGDEPATTYFEGLVSVKSDLAHYETVSITPKDEETE